VEATDAGGQSQCYLWKNLHKFQLNTSRLVQSVGTCFCVDSAGGSTPPGRFSSYGVDLLLVPWLQAMLVIWTLVVPPTRYRSTAYPNRDCQVVELCMCLLVGRGFDSPLGCSVAPTHM